jgi:hypothetical protein
VEVVCWLGLARAALLILPFSWITRRLGRFGEETSEDDQSVGTADIRRLSHMIRIAARYVPWRANCMGQALAAHAVLRRRGVAGTLYIGYKPGWPGNQPHTWLRSGRYLVTGSIGGAALTSMASYAWTARGRAADVGAEPATDLRVAQDQLP